MISSKHINKIVAVAVVFALSMSVMIVYAADAYESSYIPEYQKRLFNGNVVTIDIQADNDDWKRLNDNASDKEWIAADLSINGEVFSGVGIRTKGNSSITKTEKSESDKYSLNIELNKYVKGQTFYGLDTFCLNNMVGDATYMKEYIAYDIMSYIGVATPLTNYAIVTVNGEYYGFMLILERYEESFLDRVNGTTSGQLYNVKKEKGDNGGSLLYYGSNKNRYSQIFDNVVFKNKSDKHEERIITAIENLNAGTNLEQYWDVDRILRYFAAHTAVVNLKSYISDQQQNYYLYIREGKVTILPWSYHLAFGGYPKIETDATFFVNFPIDTPVYGVGMEDRPLLDKLLAVPEYKERYHDYLSQIVEGYFNSGLFEETIYDLSSSIGGYVQNDSSGFYSYEQFTESLANLIKFGLLRAESITGQLNGNIPSTTRGQSIDSAALIDASSVDLSSMGGLHSDADS